MSEYLGIHLTLVIIVKKKPEIIVSKSKFALHFIQLIHAFYALFLIAIHLILLSELLSSFFLLTLNIIWERKANVSSNFQGWRPAGTTDQMGGVLTLEEDALISQVHKQSETSPVIRASVVKFHITINSQGGANFRCALCFPCDSECFVRFTRFQACCFPRLWWKVSVITSVGSKVRAKISHQETSQQTQRYSSAASNSSNKTWKETWIL